MGHYAAGCHGFCLEYTFSPKELVEVIEVKYKPELPRLNQTADVDALAKDAARYKTEDWDYEDEYRIVYPKGDEYYKLPALITSIIFGTYMDKQDRETVQSLFPKIKLQYARLNFDTVKIEIEDVVNQ